MKIKGNKAYLTDDEVKLSGMQSPLEITQYSLGVLASNLASASAVKNDILTDGDYQPSGSAMSEVLELDQSLHVMSAMHKKLFNAFEASELNKQFGLE